MDRRQSRLKIPAAKVASRLAVIFLAALSGAAGCGNTSDGPSKAAMTHSPSQAAPASTPGSAKPQTSIAAGQSLQELVVREERGQTILLMKFAQPVTQYRHFTLPQPS